MIDGLIITDLHKFSNENGSVYHGMRKTDPGYNGFEEIYFSYIKPGSLKAWKMHKKMNRTEIELSAITGTWKGTSLKQVDLLTMTGKQEIKDFLTVVNLHNAEVLDDMWDTTVAKNMLREIGITCE